ncbi:MAG: hypothetical protein ACJAS3_002362 [Roseivirga sp.]|jgi:hypothetical protein
MKRAHLSTLLVGLIFMCLYSCQKKKEAAWISLFNGEDLTGWEAKIRGYEAGDNFGNTFRVEDGLLTVSYDEYDTFNNRFGLLFYEKPFSNYLLRIEYRFIGEQANGGQAWATKNSGVMLHSQSAESMGINQDFPISLEAQFLGGLGDGPRPTGNLCTPGTNVEMDGKLITQHCQVIEGPTFDGDEWVTMDLLVRGNEYIAHIVEGDTVIHYSKPTIGDGIVSGFKPEVKIDGTAIKSGYIALQSESHPIQFRKVMIKEFSNN